MVLRVVSEAETDLLQHDNQNHEITKIKTEDERYSKKSCFFLYFATIIASLTYFVVGECSVWSSPVLPKLLSNNTDINPLDRPLSGYEISLLVSLLGFGTLISPFICGKLLDVIGRRNTIALVSSLCVTSLTLTAFTSNITCLLVGRLIIGTCMGGFWIAIPIFLSEISSDHNRGKMGCFLSVFMVLGQLYCYILGPFLSVRNFTLFCILPLFLHIVILLIFFPDTPIYFLSKGNRRKAVKSLGTYRGKLCDQEIEKEMQLLERSFEELKKGSDVGLITLLTDRPARRGCLIAMVMLCVQMGTGIGIIFPFMGPIFEEAKTGLSGDMTAILVCCLKVLIYIMVSQIVERTGRKKLLFYSSVSCSISLFLLGLYFFMKENNYSFYQKFWWLPISSIIFYIFAFSIGLGPVPSATLGELFNSSVRSIAVSTAVFVSRLFSALLVSLYPLVLNYIGNAGCMWIFSTICALGATFFHFRMPETKGKSFHEIQEIFRDKKSYCNEKPV